ncbi:GAF domain-containing protein [Neobacillus massiliamazoniensis]|uniref:GAF sensor-containing diguanylate cyclase n=1 Tax=Neobacillus massiliamazoniensis TaxID=1499688 RepID=A0A0U1P204_9BACI|nr:GAF domain-containing protein [Neobacillus massiliamazoniensis]CRK84309.1 GAF sensor-containing diguanylate cyclase [Neobacillus massiliamazoniensis]
MGVNPKAKKVIFLLWILIVPVGMWYTYQTYPPHDADNWVELSAFLLLTVIVATMPIDINNVPIFLIQWITLSTFLSFGLFVEMVFSQIAVIALLLKLRVQKDQYFRFPLNGLMFFIVSLGSGAVFYMLGGQTGVSLVQHPHRLGLAVLYVVLYYVLNQIVLSFYLFLFNGRKVSFFGKDFIVETITTLITFPLGFVLYMLYYQIGLQALLFVGIPFVSVSIIFNRYYSSEKINGFFQKAAEIGHQMAERHEVNGVIDLFIQKLSEMLPVDYAYILETIDDQELKLIRRIEDGEVLSNDLPGLKKNEGIIGNAWVKQKAFLFSSKKEWNDINIGYIHELAESILCVPIARNKKVIAVLLLASKQKRAY